MAHRFPLSPLYLDSARNSSRVYLDVEEDEGQEGSDPEKDCPGDVHVVLDVDGVIARNIKYGGNI